MRVVNANLLTFAELLASKPPAPVPLVGVSLQRRDGRGKGPLSHSERESSVDLPAKNSIVQRSLQYSSASMIVIARSTASPLSYGGVALFVDYAGDAGQPLPFAGILPFVTIAFGA
jgi:hypothetical protein